MLKKQYTTLDILAYAFTLPLSLSQEEVHAKMKRFAEKHGIEYNATV